MNDTQFQLIFVILFAVVLILKSLNKIMKSDHVENNRKRVIENNETIKNNRVFFNKTVNENNTVRSNLTNKIFYVFIGMVVIFVILIFIVGMSSPLPYIVLIIAFIMYVYMANNSYSNKFKSTVLSDVIREYDPELEYYPFGGISGKEYRMCHFMEIYDYFHSEDLIVNQNKGFECCDITLEREYEDINDKIRHEIVFKGSLAKMEIKNIECNIFLGNYRSGIFNNNFQKIAFENDTFNRVFTTYTDNELVAYKILTPDVMEQFVELKEKSLIDLDIRIINDHIYIRFLSGDSFIPVLHNEKEEIDNIMESLAMVEEIIKTMDAVKDIIAKKDF